MLSGAAIAGVLSAAVSGAALPGDVLGSAQAYGALHKVGAGAEASEDDDDGPRFGALAFSAETGGWGRAWGYRTRGEAERGAFNVCANSDDGCLVAVWYETACGAVALRRETPARWFADRGRNRGEARLNAISQCEGEGEADCRILVSGCSRTRESR